MYLAVIKGEPQIGRFGVNFWQYVSLHVGGIVVESLMVADARHERSVCCKFGSQLAKKIPNRLQFS